MDLARVLPAQMKGLIVNVQIVLDDAARTSPINVGEFSGYYKGRCTVTACAQKPMLVGGTYGVVMHNVASVAPYFTYEIAISFTSASMATLEATPKNKLVLIVGCKSVLGQSDLQYLAQELESCAKPAEATEALSALCVAASAHGRGVDRTAILEHPVLSPLVHECCALERMIFIQPLLLYFLPQKGGLAAEDQRARIDKLSTQQLATLVAQLRATPWDLVFKQPLKNDYGLKPLTLGAFGRICADYKLRPPRHIELALKVYCEVRDSDAGYHKRTLFGWQKHVAQNVPLLERASMEGLVRSYLEGRVLLFPRPPWGAGKEQPSGANDFTLTDMWADAKRICQALLRYHQNSAKGLAPAVRSTQFVPSIPPRLLGAQVDAAQTILTRCVTVLEGYPGTGKTALITWAMSYFKNVLLVTLTGSMASSLRARNGGRDEVAHTIDHVIYAALHAEGAHAWLASFEVLIIDEFSNVTCPKLAQLLWMLPNLMRVVFVGDHHQIRSRKPGDPLCDMRNIFPLIELREILRVRPELKDLYEVPKLLAEDQFSALHFTPQGPLTLIEPTPSTWNKAENCYSSSAAADKGLLRKLLGEIWQLGGVHLMHHQLVVLQNSLRKTLNDACHELAQEAGLINARAKQTQIGPFQKYCVGTKITFTRNYNKPVDWLDPVTHVAHHGQTVVNGECGVITKINALPSGKGFVVTFVSDDRGKPPPGAVYHKTIIISRSIPDAVAPKDMGLGYAITTTKVQGREYPYVIFWNNRAVKPHWTRSHAYVAMTRGKERVWCVSSREDLSRICNNKDPYRRTVLYDLLQRFAPEYAALSEHTHCAGQLHAPDMQYRTLPLSVPCVPTLSEVQAERAREKKLKEEAKRRKLE